MVTAGCGIAPKGTPDAGVDSGPQLARDGATDASGFELRSTPSTVQMVAGESTTITLEVSRVAGFTQALQLVVQDLPDGVTASPTTIPEYASTLALVLASQSTAPGQTRTITISASSGLVERRTTVSVAVIPRMPFVPGAVALVSVAPSSATVQVAGTVQLTATLYDSVGTVLSGKTVRWTSSSSTSLVIPADVSGTGLVKGLSVGTATITADSGGVYAEVPVKVLAAGPGPTPSVVASVTVTSTTNRYDVVPRATLQMAAMVKDANGAALSRTVTWSTSDPRVATISGSGLLTGVALGNVTVSATTDGKSGTASVQVGTLTSTAPATIELRPLPAGNYAYVGSAVYLTAVVYDGAHNFIHPSTLSWTSSNPAVGTIEPTSTSAPASDGAHGVRLDGLSVGDTVIVARTGTVTAMQTVSVQASPPVASILISPNPVSVELGKTATVNVVAIYLQGGIGGVDTRRVVFSIANPSIATVSTNDVGSLVTGSALGTTTLTATYMGKAATAQVTVVPVPEAVASITVTPASSSLSVGGSVQLTAVVRGVSGAVLARGVSWSSQPNGIASVSDTGLSFAISPGTATIIASAGAISGTAQIVVSSPPGGTGGTRGTGGTSGTGGSSGGCASTTSLGPLTKGGTTVWVTPPTPGSLSVRVTVGTLNTGTASSPEYQYTLNIRNNTTQRLDISFAFKLGGTAPTSATGRTYIAAGGTISDPEWGPEGVAIWVRLADEARCP